MSAQLDALLAERTLSPFRVRFSAALETAFREELRGQLRLVRTIMFTAIGIGFLILPFLEVRLFRAPPELQGSFLLFAQVVTPVALLAAALTYLRAPQIWESSLQATAIVATFVSGLTIRYLALNSSLHYPGAILGTVVIAVAIFGGFDWRRMVWILSGFSALAIAQELAFEAVRSTAELNTYQLILGLLIAVGASYMNEVLRRQSWLQGRCATALSRVDMLTGLSNRSDFERRFEVTMRQARREKVNIAAMMFDIDRFKQINDQFGHTTGDLVLQAVAEAIASNCAPGPLDIKARIGREEFVVVWYDIAPSVVPEVVDQALGAVRAVRLGIPKQPELLQLTASAGACWTTPDESTDFQALVRFADALMSRAKKAGGNRAELKPFDTTADELRPLLVSTRVA